MLATATAPAYEAPDMTIDLLAGCAPELDEAAAAGDPAQAFLRAAWFRASARRTSTLVARRADGSIVAAIPLATPRRRMPLRAVPGNYWPFRAFPLCLRATEAELDSVLSAPAARHALSALTRVGPIYEDDRSCRMIVEAARRCGWTVLRRRLGASFQLDLKALTAAGDWPRKSTLSRTRGYERQLAREGALRWRTVSGSDWSRDILYELAAIERNSWVGQDTDGSGAKFLRPSQRRYWKSALADPELARALSALILYVDDRPAAFSFDLRSGPVQYGIASSYDQAFARFRPGKIVTWRGIADSIAAGIERIDWGAGDSGYKREAGAVACGEIVDLLFVRSPALAAMLRPKWEGSAPRDPARAGVADDGFGIIDHALLAAVMAGAALVLME